MCIVLMIEYNLLDSIQKHSNILTPWLNTMHFSNEQVDSVSPMFVGEENRILSKLDAIYRDGVGYHDTIGTIAFPLIIGLFAFSFPFIFQMINHINDKYESKLLSYVFRTAFGYKLFWWVNVCSINYMLFYGSGTLFCKEFFLGTYGRYWNLFSLFIVAVYVFSILIFVSYCVKFNNPDRLIGILGKRKKYESLIVRWRKIKISIKTYKRVLWHIKDKAGNKIFMSTKRLVEQWNDKTPQDNFNDRLVEVAKYAIRKGDAGLLRNVLVAFQPTIEEEKKSVYSWSKKHRGGIIEAGTHFQTLKFFEVIFSQSQLKMLDNMNESSLVFTLLNSFDKSKYVGYGNCLLLCKCLCRLVDSENITLLEKYIERSRFYFEYIRELPKKSFVLGGFVNERNVVVINSNDDWKYLCCCHFIAFAYCFEKGHCSLLKLLVKASNQGLFPNSGADVLLQYACCKKQSWRLHIDQLFDSEYDLEVLLARYTVALLLILGERKSIYISGVVTMDIIDTIEANMPVLRQEAVVVVKNGDLLNMFPQITKCDFEKNLNERLYDLKHINEHLYEYETPTKTKGKFSVSAFLLRMFGKSSALNKTEQNLYSKALDSSLLTHFESLFGQFENNIVGALPKSLFSENVTNKLESFNVNPCQLLISKYCFIYPNYYQDGYRLYGEYVEEFAARFVYLALSAFRYMNIQMEVVTSADFDIFFQDFTKGKIEDYVLVGIETPFEAILEISFLSNGLFYKKVVPYMSIETIGKYRLLKDLDDYEYFRRSLLIVKKDDLPAIVDVDEYKDVVVKFKDLSDQKTLSFDVETTVIFSKKVIYSKQSKIAIVKLKQLQM